MQSCFKSILCPERGSEESIIILPLKDRWYIPEIFENPVNGKERNLKKLGLVVKYGK